MTIYQKRVGEVPAAPPHAVVALGVFDGVHCGHTALLTHARELAREKELPLVVLTFADTPKTEKLLCSLTARRELLFSAGADFVAVYEFSELSALSPSAFVSRVLCGVFGARYAVCGTDFRFGKDRAGDAEMLAALFAPQTVVAISPVCSRDGVPISSTRIRDALAAGDLVTAEALLGRPYFLSGKVIHGRGFGHALCAPTANLAIPANIALPRDGVYVTSARVENLWWTPSVTNLGKNPTVVTDGMRTCETHLLWENTDIYDEVLTVEFRARIRAEQTFASAEELRTQIAADIETARAWFTAHPEALF